MSHLQAGFVTVSIVVIAVVMLVSFLVGFRKS
jgi:hypothetical protein